MVPRIHGNWPFHDTTHYYMYPLFPQMFAETTFVLKDVRILHPRTQEMCHNASTGRPEPIAPEFLSWRRTEVKQSPPKVAENWKLAVSAFHEMSVLAK